MPSATTPRSTRGRRSSGVDTNGASSSTSANAAHQSGKRVIKLKTRSSQRGDASISESLQNGTTTIKDVQSQDVAAVADGKSEEERLQEEMKLYERWAEEYYEIVEQLPLELHRTFALMRELETKVQDKIAFMASHTITYRDARLVSRSNDGNIDEIMEEEPKSNGVHTVEEELYEIVHPEYGSSSDRDAEGEDYDEVYHDVEANGTVAGAPTEAEMPTNEEILTPPPLVTAKTTLTPRATRESLLGAIARASSDAIRAAEEKVGLAVTAYDWVDRHIRRLDGDLQRSESSLLLGLRAGTEASRVVRDALGSGETDATFSRRITSMKNEFTMSRQASPVSNARPKKNDNTRGKSGADEEGERNEGDISKTLLTDMAIDPNEPKYCYCDEVSSGDMVACDNEDCPREWFHYHCVGLSSPPKGRWYCLFCAPPGFKGSGTFPPGAPCLPPGYGTKRSHPESSLDEKSSHKRKKKK